eukprot:1161047-Pelagomonas_calceolata.AAC.23
MDDYFIVSHNSATHVLHTLMQTTGKAFVMDDKFSLGDLLALELHNYVDACSEIVDRAQKELNIEKQLKKIEENWQALDLVFQPYQDTDIMSLIVRGCGRKRADEQPPLRLRDS